MRTTQTSDSSFDAEVVVKAADGSDEGTVMTLHFTDSNGDGTYFASDGDYYAEYDGAMPPDGEHQAVLKDGAIVWVARESETGDDADDDDDDDSGVKFSPSDEGHHHARPDMLHYFGLPGSGTSEGGEFMTLLNMKGNSGTVSTTPAPDGGPFGWTGDFTAASLREWLVGDPVDAPPRETAPAPHNNQTGNGANVINPTRNG